MRRFRVVSGHLPAVFFVPTGMRPWRFGYLPYRRREILRILKTGCFSTQCLPPRYGYRLDERIVEYPWLFSRMAAQPQVVLDAGSTLNYRWLLEHPKLRNKRLFISTLAPERRVFAAKSVSYVYEDLRHSCFKNDYFDAIVSLSVIEHIGFDNTLLYTDDAAKKERRPRDYLLAVSEFRRMVKPGGQVFLSVPFGRHADHGWYQVFDQAMVRRILETFAPRSAEVCYFRYHRDGWRPACPDECTDLEPFDVHGGTGWGPDRAAAARAVCCIELIKARNESEGSQAMRPLNQLLQQ